MRLIHTETLKFEEFEGSSRPAYIILSHRWQKQEVLYKDMIDGTAQTKKGYEKITKLCELAQKMKISYAWCDTCCIDKSSSAELSEAINSMYKWYHAAKLCVVYLFDVDIIHQHCNLHIRNVYVPRGHRYGDNDKRILLNPDRRVYDDKSSSYPPMDESFLQQFYKSEWFCRSWTLQELIASREVDFYNKSWHKLGSKELLSAPLTYQTGIPSAALHDLEERYGARTFSVAEKMSWASQRTATRVEDTAYSLWGLFDVILPLLYGEGDKAFRRLQEEIIRTTVDDSLLLFSNAEPGALADRPSDFRSHLPRFSDEEKYSARPYEPISPPQQMYLDKAHSKIMSMTSAGLQFERFMLSWCHPVCLIGLRIRVKFVYGDETRHFRAYIFVQKSSGTNIFKRLIDKDSRQLYKYLPVEEFVERNGETFESSRGSSSTGKQVFILSSRERGYLRRLIGSSLCDPMANHFEIEYQRSYVPDLAPETTTLQLGPRDILSRLCWTNDKRSTMVVTGGDQESGAVIRITRSPHDYFLGIQEEKNGTFHLCRSSTSDFHGERDLSGLLEIPEDLGYSFGYEDDSEEDDVKFSLKAGESVDIGMPGLTIFASNKAHRSTLTIVDTGDKPCSFKLDPDAVSQARLASIRPKKRGVTNTETHLRRQQSKAEGISAELRYNQYI